MRRIFLAWLAAMLLACSGAEQAERDGDAPADAGGTDEPEGPGLEGLTLSDTDSVTDTDSELPGMIGGVANLCWIRTIDGPSWELFTALAVYPDGSFIVGGNSDGDVVLGKGEANETVLEGTPGLFAEGFLARYESDGTLRWARKQGAYVKVGPGASVSDIEVTPDGGFVVLGHFWDEAVLGFGGENATILEAYGHGETQLLARYDADGELLWARRDGRCEPSAGPCVDAHTLGLDLVRMEDGSLMVGGWFTDDTWFGEGEAAEVRISRYSDGSGQNYTARYSADGQLLWALATGGHELTEHASLAWDGVFVSAGQIFADSEVFGLGQQGEAVLETNSNFPFPQGAFVSAVRDDGELRWAVPLVAQAGSIVQAMTVSDGEELVVAGKFHGNMPLGDLDDPLELIDPSPEQAQIFIAGYDADGELHWAWGGRSDVVWGPSHLRHLSWSGAGEIMLAGEFRGVADVGLAPAGQLAETHCWLETGINGPNGDQDPFVATYDSHGAVSWCARLGVQWYDWAGGPTLALDGGDFLVTGVIFGDATVIVDGTPVVLEGPNDDPRTVLMKVCPEP